MHFAPLRILLLPKILLLLGILLLQAAVAAEAGVEGVVDEGNDEIEDPAAQEEEYQRRRLEEEYQRMQEMSPVRETFEDEAGPSEPRVEDKEVSPDKGKGKTKVTPKRTKK
ncbi:hypothetical protein KFL_006310020 [Klebsormidium nitens]|uniref:Uncharacterized protein n=1 Tax=Klebsormidium nitens TaxID=105231 RepID=A0A1Y1IJP8_KLENI|nr:hypothetical protein KFL_006310020 [Klebsormidium nitens]|eukprot:GAQ90352.1 hypothetical protein KFL_006310020 [Klebsormidium nitens]